MSHPFLLGVHGSNSSVEESDEQFHDHLHSLANNFKQQYEFIPLPTNSQPNIASSSSSGSSASSSSSSSDSDSALNALRSAVSSQRTHQLASGGASLASMDDASEMNFNVESMLNALEDEDIRPSGSSLQHQQVHQHQQDSRPMHPTLAALFASAQANPSALPQHPVPNQAVAGSHTQKQQQPLLMHSGHYPPGMPIYPPGYPVLMQQPPPNFPGFPPGMSPPGAPLPLNVSHGGSVPSIVPPSPSSVDSSVPAPSSSGERQPIYLPLPPKEHRWMTRAEIASVLKAQLSQLQTSDLTTDDFYFQVHQARTKGQVPSHTVVLPIIDRLKAHSLERAKAVERAADGAPKLPDGTLGKIAASNLRKPKKLMALHAGVGAEKDEEENEGEKAKRYMFSGRSIPFLIEEGVRNLMEIEDVDSFLASLPSPSHFEDAKLKYDRYRYAQQRLAAIQQLADSLDLTETPDAAAANGNDHLLFKFTKWSKGRLLIFRALLLMAPPLTYQILLILLSDFPTVVCSLSDSIDHDRRLASLLTDILFSLPIQTLAEALYKFVTQQSKDASFFSHFVLGSAFGVTAFQIFAKKFTDANADINNPLVGPALPSLSHSLQLIRSYFDFIFGAMVGKWNETMKKVDRKKDQEKENEKDKDKEKEKENEEKKEETRKEQKVSAPVVRAGRRNEDKAKSAAVHSSSSSLGPLIVPTWSALWELLASFLTLTSPEVKRQIIAELNETFEKEWSALQADGETPSNAMKFLRFAFSEHSGKGELSA